MANKATRLFPNTVQGVVDVLHESFEGKKYAHQVIERVLKENKKWGSRDRSFVAENAYGIIRHWRKLWAMLDREPSLEKDSLYEVFGLWWLLNEHALPDWQEFDAVRDLNAAELEQSLPQDISMMESFPNWFDKRANEELGKEWVSIASALNMPAPVVLRVNTLKTNRADLQKILASEGVLVAPIDDLPNALLLNGRSKLQHLDSFKKGLFEIQDAGSQEVASFLQAKPGDFVIDSCAGAGGKTLQLVAEMKNKGLLVAMDVDIRKLRELDKRAKRNGVTIAATSIIKGNASVKTYEEKADRLLLDVPCSGSGVIKRDVDTKWKLKPEHLEKNILTQQYILKNHTKMLKPGGTLVYATCSIFKSENEDQVQWFLDQFPGKYILEEAHRLNPSELNDGFYMARLKKV